MKKQILMIFAVAAAMLMAAPSIQEQRSSTSLPLCPPLCSK